MGTDAAFYDCEGVADRALVTKLGALHPKPSDPVLLARLIDRFAGSDLGFGAVGLADRSREARRAALKHLRSMQKQARALLSLDTDPHFDLIGLALSDLVGGISMNREGNVPNRLQDAIQLLATVSLGAGASSHARKPTNDVVISNVVLAVGTYFAEMKQPFSGAPRAEMVDGKRQHLVKSEAAQLTQAVLNLLGMEVTGAQLGTHIGAARKKLAQK